MESIKPSIVIVSTDKLDPEHDAEDEYRACTEHVYSTRTHGTMWVRMYDDGRFELHTHDGVLVAFHRVAA